MARDLQPMSAMKKNRTVKLAGGTGSAFPIECGDRVLLVLSHRGRRVISRVTVTNIVIARQSGDTLWTFAVTEWSPGRDFLRASYVVTSQFGGSVVVSGDSLYPDSILDLITLELDDK